MEKKEAKEFVGLQYKALRDEIEQSKERCFKIIIGGIISVPTAEFLSSAYDVPVIIIITPLLVITLMQLYIAENNSIMRAGRFIRKEIEPLFSGIPGWEKWLEVREPNKRDKRLPDKFVNYSFFILWIIYYIIAVFLAVEKGYFLYGLIGSAGIAIIYSTAGIYLFSSMIRLTQKSTKID